MIIQNDTPLNGAEISKRMGITRQAVSYTIRKSMGKMYQYVIDEGIADSPFQAILSLMIALGVNNSDITDIQLFLRLFDKKIIKSVEEEAKSLYNLRQ